MASEQKLEPPVQVRVTCAACDGTGRRGHEEGPAGATWTVYSQCSTCRGVGYFMRWC